MSAIAVECAPVEGWLACVTVTDHGASREFEVGVSMAELARLDPGSRIPRIWSGAPSSSCSPRAQGVDPERRSACR
jgi:hypothetical protein